MFNQEKKLSIITVVYNAESSIEKTIKSVISQPYNNIEYIIIDGGSTDGTVAILDKYKENIDILVSEKDKGIYDAMNKGIDKASGKGIIFMNAGDYFVGSVLVENIQIPSFINVKTKNILGKEVLVNIKSYKSGIPNCHQGIIFENKQIKYDLSYSISSDYDYFLKHRYTSDLPILQTDGYIYYDSNGLSSKNFILRDKEVADIIKKNFGFFYYSKFIQISSLKKIIKQILNKGKN